MPPAKGWRSLQLSARCSHGSRSSPRRRRSMGGERFRQFDRCVERRIGGGEPLYGIEFLRGALHGIAHHGDGGLLGGRPGDGRDGHRSTRAAGRQLEFAGQSTEVLAKNGCAAATAAPGQLALKLRRGGTVALETFSKELRVTVEPAPTTRPRPPPRRQRLGEDVTFDRAEVKKQLPGDAAKRSPFPMERADVIEPRRSFSP
jgi:hypothetical protein